MPVGLHEIGVHLLLWGGALLLVFALFTDWLRQRVPSRRKRRCPKCWYDLSHTPGLRCSECGYEAKRERKLYKAKRRWWWATFGGILLIGSYALRVTPDVQDRGWVAAAPTTVLIVGLPWVLNQGLPDGVSHSAWISRTPPLGTVQEQWSRELVERFDRDRITNWQADMIYRRCIEQFSTNERTFGKQVASQLVWRGVEYGLGTESGCQVLGSTFGVDVELPAVWPADTPLYARLSWNPGRRWRLQFIDMACRITASASTDVNAIAVLVPFNSGRGCIPHHVDWTDDLTELGTIDSGLHELSFSAEVQVRPVPNLRRMAIPNRRATNELHEKLLTIPVVPSINRRVAVVGEATDYRQPLPDAEVETAILQRLRPILFLAIPDDAAAVTFANEQGAWQEIQPHSDPESSIANDARMMIHLDMQLIADQHLLCDDRTICLALQVEVLRNDQPVAHGEAWWNPRQFGSVPFQFPRSSGTLVPLTLVDEIDDQSSLLEGEWTLRLRGDPRIAMRDFEATHYWDGEITMPLEVKPSP